ncbi:MAG: DNA-formamidopyrimidine glycosylase, partial [Lentisphaerae bacterium]|nr:DNA-formamidopyrimidine glycosylase [Lentisphaerota bacterium]
DAAELPAPHQHLALWLDDGRILQYRDTRKFGRWRLTETPDDILSALGPEPLDAAFRWTDLYRRMQHSSRRLKPLLLDQTFLAGLGNIYVDEALWLARLHPCRSAADLTQDQARQLYRAIRRVLRQGIRHGGTTLGEGLGNFNSLNGRGGNREKLQVFQRAGRPCPRCGQDITRMRVAQRGTHICPSCQT